MRSLYLIALSFILVTPVLSQAQERKKITNELRKRFPKIEEVFYVLKNAPAQKDGSYQLFVNEVLKVNGYYANGQTDSVWEFYGRSALVSRKWYRRGEKIGKWEFFTLAGLPDWTYDFNTQDLSRIQPHPSDTTTYYYLTAANTWERDKLDRGLQPLSSVWEWESYMNRNFIYPVEAIDKGQQGKVIIAITVDKEGNPTDYTILQHAWPSLDQEALRVVKGFYHDFIPAEKNGQKVAALYQAPVVFKMESH